MICKEFWIAFRGGFGAVFRKSTFLKMLDACPQTQVLSVCLEHFFRLNSHPFPSSGPAMGRVGGVNFPTFL